MCFISMLARTALPPLNLTVSALMQIFCYMCASLFGMKCSILSNKMGALCNVCIRNVLACGLYDERLMVLPVMACFRPICVFTLCITNVRK